MRDINHDEAMVDVYRQDPAFAASVLNSTIADGDKDELLLLLRQMSKAFGGAQKIAEESKLNRTQIYRTLSAKGNPSFVNLRAILNAMGMRLAIQPIGKSTARKSRIARIG